MAQDTLPDLARKLKALGKVNGDELVGIKSAPPVVCRYEYSLQQQPHLKVVAKAKYEPIYSRLARSSGLTRRCSKSAAGCLTALLICPRTKKTCACS